MIACHCQKHIQLVCDQCVVSRCFFQQTHKKVTLHIYACYMCLYDCCLFSLYVRYYDIYKDCLTNTKTSY